MNLAATVRQFDFAQALRHVDWLGPLALRLYLVPVFWVAGMNKISGIENVIEWFGNDQWGLGLPFPFLMAWLATLTEVVGAALLLVGFGTRLISIPLMITMIVAAVTVHWENGWQAVHDLKSPFANANAEGAADRLGRAKDILQEHGNYDWLTETGSFVVSNSGIEWAATYFVMLLALLMYGPGKASVDHIVGRMLKQD
ncbi:MAG: DoxX family protein [Pseudomonadota bacterium]